MTFDFSDAKEREQVPVPVPPCHNSRKRNLIFDEERFEETFLKCLICRENFDSKEKAPKMLPCHHTFCLECLRQMFRVEGEFRQNLTSTFRSMPFAVKISCPTCREGLIVSESEIKRLPMDHTVTELLSFVEGTGKTDIQFCSKHQMQPLNFFCEPCIMPICSDCTVIDHKESGGHIVMNVDEALEKYEPMLEETTKTTAAEKQSIDDKKSALERAFENVEQIQKELGVQIRQTFDRIRDTLDERERELFSISEQEIERKRKEIKECMDIVVSRENSINKVLTSLKKAKEEKDISSMFSSHKNAVETLSDKVQIPTPPRSTEDFAVSFQFNSRKEANIRQYVNNFGDVLFKNN